MLWCIINHYGYKWITLMVTNQLLSGIILQVWKTLENNDIE